MKNSKILGHTEDRATLVLAARLVAGFALASGVGFLVREGGWERYLAGLYRFFDAEQYVRIAQNGYPDASMTAFFPLWPFMIRSFARGLGIEGSEQVGLLAGVLSFLIFLAVIVGVSRWFLREFGERTAGFVAALFVLNPMSIFHVIGYSESLCCLLLVALMMEINSLVPRKWLICILSVLVSLARPVAFFLPVAALVSWPVANWVGGKRLTKDFGVALAIAGGALLGFGIFCAYLDWFFGDPLASLHGQEMWGRKLGFYGELIWNPSAVGGSGQVLFWDLVGFYGAFALLGWLAWLGWKGYSTLRGVRVFQEGQEANAAENPALWFAILVAAGHSLVQLLTYPLFASVGRQILGLPLFFYGLGYAVENWVEGYVEISADKSEGKIKRRLWLRVGIVLVAAAFLVRWWARFAKGAWIG